MANSTAAGVAATDPDAASIPSADPTRIAAAVPHEAAGVTAAGPSAATSAPPP